MTNNLAVSLRAGVIVLVLPCLLVSLLLWGCASRGEESRPLQGVPADLNSAPAPVGPVDGTSGAGGERTGDDGGVLDHGDVPGLDDGIHADGDDRHNQPGRVAGRARLPLRVELDGGFSEDGSLLALDARVEVRGRMPAGLHLELTRLPDGALLLEGMESEEVGRVEVGTVLERTFVFTGLPREGGEVTLEAWSEGAHSKVHAHASFPWRDGLDSSDHPLD